MWYSAGLSRPGHGIPLSDAARLLALGLEDDPGNIEQNAALGTELSPVYEAPRPGDVRHSVADVGKARDLLEYTPAVSLRSGLEQVLQYFRDNAEVWNGIE